MEQRLGSPGHLGAQNEVLESDQPMQLPIRFPDHASSGRGLGDSQLHRMLQAAQQEHNSQREVKKEILLRQGSHDLERKDPCGDHSPGTTREGLDASLPGSSHYAGLQGASAAGGEPNTDLLHFPVRSWKDDEDDEDASSLSERDDSTPGSKERISRSRSPSKARARQRNSSAEKPKSRKKKSSNVDRLLKNKPRHKSADVAVVSSKHKYPKGKGAPGMESEKRAAHVTTPLPDIMDLLYDEHTEDTEDIHSSIVDALRNPAQTSSSGAWPTAPAKPQLRASVSPAPKRSSDHMHKVMKGVVRFVKLVARKSGMDGASPCFPCFPNPLLYLLTPNPNHSTTQLCGMIHHTARGSL